MACSAYRQEDKNKLTSFNPKTEVFTLFIDRR